MPTILNVSTAIATLVLLTSAVAPAAEDAPAGSPTLPDCRGQLSIALDSENGYFDGMSHSGTLLVVRNIGTSACETPGLPLLEFRDKDGRPLNVVREKPVGMHPGPVVLPVRIAAGAEATAPLRWVSSDAFDGHNCVTPAKLTIAALQTDVPFGMQLCGAAGAPITFEQPPLHTDPVLK